MVGNSRQSGGFASAALALLLLFRLLIPSGYMIAPDSDGRPGLALCAAPARAAVQAAMHGIHDGHSDPAPSRSDETPCAFAALAAPPLPPEPPVLEPHFHPAAVAPDLPANPHPRRIAPAAPPPPARGPPLLV
ncbi:MAG TPA: hypothetical protein VF652_04455 [Allosphingosinicella sp.]|jgi:hypothetical protein